MCNVLGYVRVSTDEQVKNGQGIEIQIEQLREYKKNLGLGEMKIFVDKGISGANEITKRQGLQELMTYASENESKYILVTKMDRLARDLYIQLWLEKEFKKMDLNLVSITEDNLNGNDYMTLAMRQMVGVFAELEKNRIADRLLSGRIKKASTGKKASGNCPFGYIYEFETPEKLKVVIEPEKAEIVKDIFKRYLKGDSLEKVKKHLDFINAKTNRDNLFGRTSIRHILTNRFYIGEVTFGDITKEGEHKPIIDKITFGKVQARLKRNNKRA